MKLKHFYYKEYHSRLPHVVKFSGGRSSGALLFSMLENGMLDANRGDVIIFNNTSAEHQKTYDFVIECKRKCEKEYNIPFFLTEFQTYEDCKNGIYDRFSTYKLVNDRPYSKENPNGYHCKGEVFEELISWQMYLPSLMSGRTCTKKMKMDVTYSFLRDWFSGLEEINRLGHYGNKSRIDISILYEKHLKNGGKVPFDIYKNKKDYCLKRPLYRPEQKFSDYTNVKIDKNIYIHKRRIEFCSFIGFRADEPLRLEKMKSRINKKYNENINMAYLREENEHIYAPLVESGITQKDIKLFWDNQDFDLGLPYDGSLGNCVFCFMKGANKLSLIQSESSELTPQNIDWWIYIEKKYQRDLEGEGRDITTKEDNPYINFFGVNGKLSYEIIKNKIDVENIQQSLPCNCTD
jgi:3'-phosphoadenosine 5'-phosphosulfate sulfotransferase (PAPS reductase)/FAD synthetase